MLQLGGRYLLYYTASDVEAERAVHRRRGREPIRSARSSTIVPEPIVCQTELGGSIDADAFRDADGKLYLYFKNDGNRVGKHTAIWGQQLSADGLVGRRASRSS